MGIAIFRPARGLKTHFVSQTKNRAREDGPFFFLYATTSSTMTFLEIRSLNLEEDRPASHRNASNILDQIKRSAGNTPAKRMMPPPMEDRSDRLRHIDTEGGFAGFGVTPHADLAAYSFTTGDFSLFPSSVQTKDEISLLFEKHHQKMDDRGFLVDHGETPASMLDTRRTVSTEETTIFSPMHLSVESRSTDDRSWVDGCEEPLSLLDYTDGEEDDDDYDEEDYTTSGVIGGTDDESYDSEYDDEDDDETLLTNEETKGPITGVESFLDELAEVEDVQDLGSLLYQVGSCNFAADLQTADEEFSVNSDAFPTVPLERIDPSRVLGQQHQEEIDPHPPIISSSSSLLEGTTDTLAMLIHNVSITTDSMFEIMNSHSMMSESKDGTVYEKKDNDEVSTPNNANLTFFQSMFGCQG